MIIIITAATTIIIINFSWQKYYQNFIFPALAEDGIFVVFYIYWARSLVMEWLT